MDKGGKRRGRGAPAPCRARATKKVNDMSPQTMRQNFQTISEKNEYIKTSKYA